MKKIFLFSLVFFLHTLCYSRLVLPAVISDGMILQQNSNVSIWGKSNPKQGVSIVVGWSSKKYQTVANENGLWAIKIETPIASFSEYSIKILSGKETKDIDNVLIGEVWLCGGQSNMEMKMKGYFNQPVINSTEDIAYSSNKYLRCYTISKISSVKVKEDTKGDWKMASPGTTGEFTATGYYFGRLLQQTLNVPVGLLSCSWGGSVIEAWMSPDAFEAFPSYVLPQTEADNKAKNKVPTVLYNGMINPIQGYGMRGAIWYQGEANIENYKNYPDLFQAMHLDWIKKWDIGIFPIYFCQIAPFKYSGSKENTAFMRESQLKVAQTQKNTGIAVLVDVGDSLCIHPAEKRKAGERLAYIAMSKTYGYNNFPCKSPEYKSINVKANKITVSFNYSPDGLTTFGKVLGGFEVSGVDRVFYPATAKIIKEGVEVSSPKVSEPVAVRYAFKNYFRGTLLGVNGLPVSSFRSDDWDDVK